MIVKTDKDLDKVFEFIQNNEIIAFDNETTGLNTRKERVIGFAVSNADTGFYIAHLNYDKYSNELNTLVSREKCVDILNALKNKRLLMFNGSFDTRITFNYFGIDLVPSLYCDVMLLKHTVDEEQPFRLKEIAKKVFGEDAAEEQKLMKESIKSNGGSVKEFYKADLDLMGRYAIQDTLLTYKLYDYYTPVLKRENLEDFFYKDEVMPLYREVTIPMEQKGIPVNLELLRKTQAEIVVDIGKIEKELYQDLEPLLGEFKKWFLWKEYPPKRSGDFAQTIAEIQKWKLPLTPTGKLSITKKTLEQVEDSIFKDFVTGGDYLPEEEVFNIQMHMFAKSGIKNMFNLNSKTHLKKIFFEKLNETPLSTTKLGNPQVNDEFLDLMAEKYSWANKLRTYNKLSKLKSTYMDRILDLEEDGIFYPSFFQHKTISGRYGSDIQQLPRPKEDDELDSLVLRYNNLIRKFFISGKGFKFIDSDYESLEPHVFAHVSGDNGLKNIFLKGHDFYSTIAIQTEELQGASSDKKADNYLGKLNSVKRQSAKAYALGVPYGMEEFSLSKKLNIDQKKAKKLINGYLNGFPRLKKWMEDSFEQVVSKGFVVSQAGRVRHFPTAPKIWYTYGKPILNSLELWKKYSDSPKKYKQMKFLRRKFKNMLDNGKNFQIQSLAASIVNRSAIAISRELKRRGIEGYVCANVHDQLIVRVPEEHAEKCKRMVQYLMENTYKISIPLKAPAEIANDFYEGH